VSHQSVLHKRIKKPLSTSSISSPPDSLVIPRASGVDLVPVKDQRQRQYLHLRLLQTISLLFAYKTVAEPAASAGTAPAKLAVFTAGAVSKFGVSTAVVVFGLCLAFLNYKC
jgi:hypothetical protein